MPPRRTRLRIAVVGLRSSDRAFFVNTGSNLGPQSTDIVRVARVWSTIGSPFLKGSDGVMSAIFGSLDDRA